MAKTAIIHAANDANDAAVVAKRQAAPGDLVLQLDTYALHAVGTHADLQTITTVNGGTIANLVAAPTMADFNNLLAKLRTAKVIS